MDEWFRKFAHRIAAAVGSKEAFVIAVGIVLLWLLAGPIFGYSDSWQLVINTGTTIVTFLMVFLIQYTQNHDGQATQLKLDELIRSIKDARNQLVDVEEDSDQTLQTLQKEFKQMRNGGAGSTGDDS
jgi:low affinity Fe/Cu permease